MGEGEGEESGEREKYTVVMTYPGIYLADLIGVGFSNAPYIGLGTSTRCGSEVLVRMEYVGFMGGHEMPNARKWNNANTT